MRPLILILSVFCFSQSFSQSWKWTRAVSGNPFTYFDYRNITDAYNSAIDEFGNVYAAFSTKTTFVLPDTIVIANTTTYDKLSVLIKYDASGNMLWYKLFPDWYVQSLAINHEGDLYLGGMNEDRSFLAQCNNNGELQWYKPLEYSGTRIFKMRLDAYSNIYTARFEMDSVVIRKQDPEGNLLWRKGIAGVPTVDLHGAYEQTLGAKLYVNDSGSVQIAGQFSRFITFGDTTLVDTPFISAKKHSWSALYNNNGDLKYALQLRGATEMGFQGITVDNNDHAILFTNSRGLNNLSISGTIVDTIHGPLMFFIDTQGYVKRYNDSLKDDLGPWFYATGIRPLEDGTFLSIGSVNSSSVKEMIFTVHDSTGKMISYTADASVFSGQFFYSEDFKINKEGFVSIAGKAGSSVVDIIIGPDKFFRSSNSFTLFASKLHINGNTVRGRVYVDFNNNSVADSGETGLRGFVIAESSDRFTTASDRNGSYSLLTDTGNYQVSLGTALKYYTVQPASHSVSFAQRGTNVIDKNFRLIPEANKTDIEVSLTAYTPPRPGFPGWYNLTYTNVGTVASNGPVAVTFPPAIVVDSSSVPPVSITGNTRTWTFSLTPLRSHSIILYTHVAVGTPLLAPLTSVATVNTTGDLDLSNNSDTLHQTVTGSFDPNDKTVLPAGDRKIDEIRKDHMIDYLVRFQNTGTDTAFNVLVVDEILNLLNIDSLQVIAASHPYEMEIKDNKVNFIFNNILLPHEAQNEPRSHGFIRFRVAAKTSVQVGDTLKNRVGIYFDYNDPVVTPYANIVLLNATVTGIFDPVLQKDVALTVFTDPTSTRLNYYIKYPNPDRLNLKLYTMDGRLVDQWTQQYVPGQSVYSKGISLPAAGTYLLHMQGKKGSAVRKFIYNR